MNYFTTLFLTERKNPKFLVFFFMIISLTLISFVATLTAKNDFLFAEIRADRGGVKNTLANFQQDTSTSTNDKILVKNLNQQTELLARMEQSLLFEDNDLFNQAAVEMTAVRAEFFRLPQAKKYATNFPTPQQNALKQVFYQNIKATKQPLYAKNDRVILAVLVFFNFFSFGWFLLNSLLNCNIWLSDQLHLRTVQGFPISKTQRISTKLIFYLTVSLIGLLIPVIIAGATSLFVPSGSLTYPVAIYLNTYKTVPFWQYTGFLLGLSFLIALFSAIFSYSLNLLTKNLYLSIFFSFAAFFIPYFLGDTTKMLWFLPFNYLNPVAVLEGSHLATSQLGNYWSGIAILFLWAGILLGLISWKWPRRMKK